MTVHGSESQAKLLKNPISWGSVNLTQFDMLYMNLFRFSFRRRRDLFHFFLREFMSQNSVCRSVSIEPSSRSFSRQHFSFLSRFFFSSFFQKWIVDIGWWHSEGLTTPIFHKIEDLCEEQKKTLSANFWGNFRHACKTWRIEKVLMSMSRSKWKSEGKLFTLSVVVVCHVKLSSS